MLALQMQTIKPLACAFLVLLFAIPSYGQEPLKPGPQAGEQAYYFHPLFVHGKHAGKKVSITQYLHYDYGRPYALVFIRSTDDATLKLIRKLDEAAEDRKRISIGLVMLSDDAKIVAHLEKLVAKEKFKATTVAVYDNLQGPKTNALAKEAEATVVFVQRTQVFANFAFQKTAITDAAIQTVIDKVKTIKAKQ
ncbi:MAG: hypothetical protein FJ303_02665 [Planctomycetes bacterium]|nr:hypothetical protein [Planctomycetota bacterium]